MSDRDVLEEARVEAARRWGGRRMSDRLPIDWLDEGMASGFVLGAQWAGARLADESAESRAEVERLREWKRLHSADVLSIRAEQAEVEEQRDESQAEVERLRQAVDDAVHLYHQALEERDEARAANKRVRELHEPLECPCGTCDVVICAECLSEAHPCPTIRVLDDVAEPSDAGVEALAGRVRAFARDCVEHGDMTPAAALMLDRVLDGGEQR